LVPFSARRFGYIGAGFRSPDGIELGPGEALIAWKNLPSQTFCGVSGVLTDNGENLSLDVA
jgi:hypothetical protein